MVVLTDMYYPGWKAQIDDKPVEILRADLVMRAVAVPSGKHSIVFSYFPDSLKIGLYLFCLGLILGLILALIFIRKTSKSTAGPSAAEQAIG
jgi:uncharacterized membrane protein YfhO